MYWSYNEVWWGALWVRRYLEAIGNDCAIEWQKANLARSCYSRSTSWRRRDAPTRSLTMLVCSACCTVTERRPEAAFGNLNGFVCCCHVSAANILNILGLLVQSLGCLEDKTVIYIRSLLFCWPAGNLKSSLNRSHQPPPRPQQLLSQYRKSEDGKCSAHYEALWDPCRKHRMFVFINTFTHRKQAAQRVLFQSEQHCCICRVWFRA